MPKSFSLEGLMYDKIARLFASHSSLLTQDFEERIKQSIRVLHFTYLWGACREAEIFISKHKDKTQDLFNLIMSMYSKRRKEHSAKFLLLHCYENAFRSILATGIANIYNRINDDWFLQDTSNKKAIKLQKRIANIAKQRNLDINNFKNTFEVFDVFTLSDLGNILNSHWGDFAHYFTQAKTYKNQELPIYGTKASVLTKIDQIRNARNEIFHNKPTKIKFQKDLEILILRFGYNLKDALNIGNIQDVIQLHYKY